MQYSAPVGTTTACQKVILAQHPYRHNIKNKSVFFANATWLHLYLRYYSRVAGELLTTFHKSFMSKLLTSGEERAWHVLRRLLISLLLVLYMLGTSPPEQLRHFLHSDNHFGLHSAESEQDACHRWIYHHDVEGRCTHDSHIFLKDTCAGCGITAQTAQMLPQEPEYTFLASDVSQPACPPFNEVSFYRLIISSRAPPGIDSVFLTS